jgi:hypothetical protein
MSRFLAMERMAVSQWNFIDWAPKALYGINSNKTQDAELR